MAEPEHPENDPLDPSEIILQTIFDDALSAVVKREPKPVVEASFYPYAGLSSTIRLRQGRVYVRVSDLLRHSPREVLYALACILVSKLYRLKVSKEHERTYRQHTLNPSILGASEDARRKRGYKITTTPRGKVYDLESLFDELNERYFAGTLARPKISWSARRARRVLGHHDHIHGAIIISRLLDSPRIPRFVLEYVLFHEMLHIKHPARVVGDRTIYHSRDFRKDERRFGRYEEALGWLEKISPPARRRRRR
jgi:predicted metal-dependent hydrolase